MSPEYIEVVPVHDTNSRLWNPIVKAETEQLFAHLGLSDTSKEAVLVQAQEILGRCVSPLQPDGQRTGLVLGYVQSGKTLSFTTVTALARDNGYRIVIILAGTSIPLLNQSFERLEKDLRLDKRRDRQWKAFPNPSIKGQLRSIESALRNWIDPQVPLEERQTILITVIKNVKRVQELTRLLSALKTSLAGAPVLVIDDEADQAGLNTKVKAGQQSATYKELLALRSVIPHLTYLQYTATPQAPLLINIIDVLSPSFVWVLSPGSNYTGGKTFFVEQPHLIEVIPESEIPDKDTTLITPPASLHRAMRYFFVGVAAGMFTNDTQANRSMMVHPSQDTARHNDYYHWVEQAKSSWVEVMALPPTDPDRIELEQLFREAYRTIANEVPDIPPFANIVNLLPRAMRSTLVTKVNSKQSGGTPPVSWHHEYAHILVGGQALDRGFTVEGLTVTYMPRGVGVGNADTVQQRARFFGYKSGYLGFCRVFLSQETKNGFTRYVEHEENIREQLTLFAAQGKPLSEWKRAFFLDPSFSPTRASVLDLDLYKINLRDGWYSTDSPHLPTTEIAANKQVVDGFVQLLDWQEQKGHPDRTQTQIHNQATTKLIRVYRDLLTRLIVGQPNDSRRLTAILLQIEDYLRSYPNAQCIVYHMSKGAKRKRGVNDADEIKNLFQGAYPNNSKDIYPGDRKVLDNELVSVQIHHLTLSKGESTQLIADDVVAIAIWLPQHLRKPLVIQEEVL